MKITNLQVSKKAQEKSVDGMIRHIEYCGKVAYQSPLSKDIDGAYRFVERMQKSDHGAVLEHGTAYLDIPLTRECMDAVRFYMSNPYSRVLLGDNSALVTTNYRVIFERQRKNMENDGFLFNDFKYWAEDNSKHAKRHTFEFVCEIATSREFNRHRVNSILEESTRYNNYSREKYGSELTVIMPSDIPCNKTDLQACQTFGEDFNMLSQSNAKKFAPIVYWWSAMRYSECMYFKMIEAGCVPDQARRVLPLGLKTHLVHTAFEDDWKHFIDLRANNSTGKAHHTAQLLASHIKLALTSGAK